MTNEVQQEASDAATTEPSGADVGGGMSVVDIVVLAVCAIGVVAALVVVLDYSGLTLFDSHAAEVIADAWNRNATIGLIVAIVVAIGVGLFVYALAKSTLGSTKVPGEPSDDH